MFPTQADKLIDGRLASHAQLNQDFIFCVVLLWTLFTNELMSFSLMIVYQLLCSPTYVHLCKCLSQCEIKKDLRKIR